MSISLHQPAGGAPEFDFAVAIVGGGLAGAAAAALLAHQSGLPAGQIVLLAAELPAPLPADAPPDLRVTAISRASERVLGNAAAWSGLNRARVMPYERMRVWHETSPPGGGDVLGFEAADLGEPNLGYIIENRELTRSCVASFRAAGGRVRAHKVQGLDVREDGVQIETDAGRLRCRLVVGADGIHSLVRERTGLHARIHDHRQHAVVATVRTGRPHASTAWQRFMATGPLALLPLYDGSSSIVWSIDNPLVDELMQCSAAEFGQRLTRASDQALGECELVSERLAFPLCSLAATSYIAPRCALIGDAAHVVLPLAGQGANLGLLDAAALCEAVQQALAEHEDCGALRILRRYEQRRRSHNLLVGAAMQAFNAAFSTAPGPGAWLAARALAGVNRIPAVKRLLAAQALGTTGELPRLARRAG